MYQTIFQSRLCVCVFDYHLRHSEQAFTTMRGRNRPTVLETLEQHAPVKLYSWISTTYTLLDLLHLRNYRLNDSRLPKLSIDQHVICDQQPEKCHMEQKGLWVLRSWCSTADWGMMGKNNTHIHTHLSSIDYLPGCFTHTHSHTHTHNTLTYTHAHTQHTLTHIHSHTQVLFHFFHNKKTLQIILLSNQQHFI